MSKEAIIVSPGSGEDVEVKITQGKSTVRIVPPIANVSGLIFYNEGKIAVMNTISLNGMIKECLKIKKRVAVTLKTSPVDNDFVLIQFDDLTNEDIEEIYLDEEMKSFPRDCARANENFLEKKDNQVY